VHESGVRCAYVAFPMTRNLLAAVSVVLLLPVSAQADGETGDLQVSKPLPESTTYAPPVVVGNGGWLFADSPHVASTLQPVVISRFTYSDSSSLTRPFAANTGTPGAAAELGGELGLGAGFSVQASAVRGSSFVDDTGATGGMAGVRFSVLPASIENWQLVLNAGWLHELAGANGVYSTIQAGFETGPVRSQLSLHVEHLFQEGRDAVDVMVTAGVAVKVVSFMSLGVEYVGQDLESTFINNGADSEGGARHLLGPTIAFAVIENRLSIVGGPALAMGATNLRVVARLALSYGF